MLSCLLLAFSFFSSSGSLQEKEEGEKKQLHNNAERHFAQKEYGQAKEGYEKLVKKIPFSQSSTLAERNYVDVHTRLGEIYLLVKEYEKGVLLLTQLLEKPLSAHLYPTISVLLAKHYAYLKKSGEGFLVMQKALTKLPFPEWRPEERSFYHAVEYALNDMYEGELQKAKRLFVTHNYQAAITLYEGLLEGINKGYFPKAHEDHLLKKKVSFRLAESYLHEANYEKTLSLTGHALALSDEVDREMLYLAATAYQEQRSYEKALELFESYLASATPTALFHYENALFEAGNFYFRAENYEKAKQYFLKIFQNPEKKQKVVLLSALYLGRIALKEGKLKEAEQMFTLIQEQTSVNDPLFMEAVYWQGETLLLQANHAKATQAFEKALSSYYLKGEFSRVILYKLALCYLQSDNPALLERAERILKKQLTATFKEPPFFALLSLYSKKKQSLPFEALVKEKGHLLSEEGKIELLLLTASLKPTYEEREAIYAQATDIQHASNPSYFRAWHARAVNHLEHGLQAEGEKDHYFKVAILCLEKAFTMVEKRDKRKAASILQLEIETYSLLNEPLFTLALLEKLEADFPLNEKEREEKLYLKGLIASKIEGELYLTLAEQTFKEVVATFPAGEYADDALFALGTLYYKKGNYPEAIGSFTTLYERYPHSPYLADTYYWAAESLERFPDTKEKVTYLRKAAYRCDIASPRAPEAYFKTYEFNEYLRGHEEALTHIRAFASLFPQSPLRGIAYYLSGRSEKSYAAACELLTQAKEALNVEIERTKGSDPSFLYFRNRTLLELALLDLHFSSDLTQAFSILTTLIHDFTTNAQGAAFFKQMSLYPPLFEESEFALALVYLKLHKENLAHETLLSMLKHYSEAGIHEGYYLARAWIEKGRMSFLKEDYATALSCFEVASECGRGYLNDEERLTLGIFQSHCHRQLHNLESAMLILSQVINEGHSSPLRHQAMVLRAEIYELQGRRELAIKQLEAIAKKEGAWAHHAREKLRYYHAK